VCVARERTITAQLEFTNNEPICSFSTGLAGRYNATMTKPNPEAIDPAELVALAQKVIAGDRFPHLASVDGPQPRVRPVSPVKTDGFDVYVANLRQYHKTVEIEANPRVELCYLDGEHNQVRITGVADVVTDRALLEEIWENNPLLRQYLGTIDNPELIVYRIRPQRVRYMREWALEYHEVPWEA
jgi:general stress protein 26